MKATRENALVDATVRKYLWEVPINFPGSRNDFKEETFPAISDWLHRELAKDKWGPNLRADIIELIREELFGPKVN